jgi:hypothetical protein
MEYVSIITYHSNDMAMLKILKSRSNVKVRRSTIVVPIEKSCHKEITALSLIIQKI